jgi:hypothetical protein
MPSTTDSVDLSFLQEQQRLILEELKLMRRESQGIRQAMIGMSERVTRLDRRLNEVKDDMESILQVHIGGSISNLETRLDNRFAEQLEEIRQLLNLHSIPQP